MSTRTIKLPYTTKSEEDSKTILKYIKNYNNALRFTYNRLLDNKFELSTKQITQLQKSMNNIFVDSHFLNSAQYDAKQFKGKEHVIFGGKFNFIQRCQNKIDKNAYQLNRLVPICSIGEGCKQGNRKFTILSESSILFKPCKSEHVIITLPKLRANYLRTLKQLKQLQDQFMLPITYRLGLDCISITFEDTKLIETNSAKLNDRIFAIDLNPNYIGWSVVDWRDSSNYLVVDSGVISNKQINDAEYALHKSSDSPERLYLSNKRTFENSDIAKYLANLAKHYQCELFSIEKLEILPKDNRRGKRYNRLVNNQWNRNIFYNQIRKYCDRYNIKFYEVVANYSSFEGNLIYRETKLPDMCLASIELGRRAYEFHHQYVLRDKPKEKNIMFDNSEKAHSRIIQSLEELHYDGAFEDIISLYKEIKSRNMKYRLQLEESILTAVSSKKSIKSKILLYGSV